MKRAVGVCELSEDNDKFYNNSDEAINKLIKHWQNFEKTRFRSFLEGIWGACSTSRK